MKGRFLKRRLVIIFCVMLITFSLSEVYCFDYEDLDMKLRASISCILDDNITFLNKNEKEDFITNLSVGLGLKYEGKVRNLELEANIDQQIFGKYHNFNNTSEDISFVFQQEFSKYDRISLKDVFSHTYEPRSFEDAFGRTKGRYSYYRNKFTLNYSRDIAKQLSLGVRYANEMDEVSRSDLSDSYLNKIGLQADYFSRVIYERI